MTVTTDHPNAETQAKLLHAAELTAVWVPDEAQERPEMRCVYDARGLWRTGLQ